MSKKNFILEERRSGNDILLGFNVYYAENGTEAGTIDVYLPDDGGNIEFIPHLKTSDITKAMDPLIDWALKQPRAVRLRCSISDNERETGKALQKAGFISSITERGRLCWDMKLDDSGNYIFVFACAGLILGLICGMLLKNVGIGAVAGLVVGLAVGVLLYFKGRKRKRNRQ